MGLLSGIWSKVSAGLAVVIAVFWFFIKYQSSRIDSLKKKNKTLSKKNELKEQSAVDVANVVANEQKEILEMTKGVNASDKKITLDDINNL